MELPEEVPIILPEPLKTHLEDDCFWILKRAKLVRLPAVPTVEDLLRDYYIHCIEGATEETNLSLLAEVLDGLKIYFDFLLADHLLYLPEKSQHRQLGLPNPVVTRKGHMQPQPDPTPQDHTTHLSNSLPVSPMLASSVYGVHHLLRLFIKLPMFLSHAQLPPSHIQILHYHCRDLLGYVCSKRNDLFLEEHYEDTAPPNAGSNSTELEDALTSTEQT